MGLDAEKRELRRRMAEVLRSLEPRQRIAAAEAAGRAVVETAEFRWARVVAIYAARPDEPATGTLFEAVLDAGKRCVLPRCLAAGGLAFACVERWGDLRPGRYGLLEPPPEQPATALGDEDLVVLPGMAFDASGARLGRGSGYYDRTFRVADRQGPTLFGLAFACQLVERVPSGDHDRRVAAVASELGLLRVRAASATRREIGAGDE